MSFSRTPIYAFTTFHRALLEVSDCFLQDSAFTARCLLETSQTFSFCRPAWASGSHGVAMSFAGAAQLPSTETRGTFGRGSSDLEKPTSLVCSPGWRCTGKYRIPGHAVRLVDHDQAGRNQRARWAGEARAALWIRSPVKISTRHLLEISIPHTESYQPLVLEKVSVPLTSSEVLWIFMEKTLKNAVFPHSSPWCPRLEISHGSQLTMAVFRLTHAPHLLAASGNKRFSLSLPQFSRIRCWWSSDLSFTSVSVWEKSWASLCLCLWITGPWCGDVQERQHPCPETWKWFSGLLARARRTHALNPMFPQDSGAISSCPRFVILGKAAFPRPGIALFLLSHDHPLQVILLCHKNRLLCGAWCDLEMGS